VAVLAPYAPDCVAAALQKVILPAASSHNTHERHGAVCVIGPAVAALHALDLAVPPSAAEGIEALVQHFVEAGAFRGLAGLELRGAVCDMQQQLAHAGFAVGSIGDGKLFVAAYLHSSGSPFNPM